MAMASASTSVSISAETARRFVLGRQGLWPGRRTAGKDGARAAMTAMEQLQLDPLVIVARSHDLALHSRVVGYETAFFDELTYGERLFFDWGGWLAVRPMRELPYWRRLMHRQLERPKVRRIVDEHGEAFRALHDLLRERGTLSNRDFDATDRRAVDSYRGRKDSSLALYYLWLVGDAMTHHREGFERVYAPAEAVAPPELLVAASDADTDRFMMRKAVAFAGIGRPGPLSLPLVRKIGPDEERALERELVESGVLIDVEIEGWPGRHFMTADDLGVVSELAEGRVPQAWTPIETTTREEVTLLSPLDPAVNRVRAKALFGFDYVWEIYKKLELVQYGRYTMPMLWGEQLVGRIDLRTDRRAKMLVVNGAWLEDKTLARAPDFLDALRAGVQRMSTFLGTDRVDAAAVSSVPVRRAIASLDPKRRSRKPIPKS
jgi:uncharacterized protein YcaQ